MTNYDKLWEIMGKKVQHWAINPKLKGAKLGIKNT